LYKENKNKFFLVRRVLVYSSIALVVLFIASSAASRLYASPIGFSLIASGSMEPGIRVLDIVIYTPLARYLPGDVVVWCSTPAFCVVHRLVNITDTYIVTKGDANPLEDNPIPREALRGRVIFVIPREVWIPFLAALVVYPATRFRGDPVYVASLTLMASTASMALVVFLPSTPPPEAPPNQPVIYLSTYSLDPSNCIAEVTYTGEMRMISARVYVNGSEVAASLAPGNISIPLDPGLLSEAYAGGYVEVHVLANLTMHGILEARYLWKLIAPPPRVLVNSSGIEVENPNCFPVEVNVTYLYANKPGEAWSYRSVVLKIPGKGSVFVGAPDARYVYADVRYIAWGVERWERLTVR